MEGAAMENSDVPSAGGPPEGSNPDLPVDLDADRICKLCFDECVDNDLEARFLIRLTPAGAVKNSDCAWVCAHCDGDVAYLALSK